MGDDLTRWPTGRLLSAATRHVEREWNAHLAGWGLNHASFPVLMHLLRGPRTQRELAAENKVTEQTMSRILDRLERTGHVSRALDPHDKRRRTVSITDAGRAAAFSAAEPRRADEISTQGLDGEQIDTLRALLIAMVRSRTD
ncbi:DNA-binding MarR family transcriptional regulator [Sediminihabitans luteus]|uniref:DNA-binding MarR family transcriptional regulator n=1 Tax=Sediminihabitans luteus TaxID=1138585 RepID=A0A2M9CQ23_9CELL|nr:MarR family transcriptional regulator [Sediminihabitans luteus]PJJ74014.1 DNA-binding MarR family transcriptional regulator [Sediminihabitans luteus]GII98071.1 hypothetical protein Slu03_04490 [Sediminihabitans luteus]